MKCKHGYEVDANGNHIIIPKKYEVVKHETMGTLKKGQIVSEPEPKPVSFEQIKKLYDKEFPPTITKPVNEIKKLKQLIDNAQR